MLQNYVILMLCWFDLDIFNPTMVMCLVWSMICVDLLIVIAFQCSCVTLRWMYDLLDLTIFSLRSLIFGLLSSHFYRTEVFVWFVLGDVILWHIWLNHFESSISYFWDAFQVLVENWCVIVNYLLMLSSHLYRTKANFIWFFDLYFYELWVGYLYVMLGSGLQWRSGPKVAAKETHCKLFNKWKHYTRWE